MELILIYLNCTYLCQRCFPQFEVIFALAGNDKGCIIIQMSNRRKRTMENLHFLDGSDLVSWGTENLHLLEAARATTSLTTQWSGQLHHSLA